MECIEGESPDKLFWSDNIEVLKKSLGSHTSVNAKYPIIDDNGQCQEVKHVRKISPDVRRAVFPHAFCIETIRL
jgi:hypothetical protein